MAPPIDPYRTLGLSPGATTAEIKAAYRRLAKEFHPDAAGERAIARFLAIQAAYDALTGPSRPPTDNRRTPDTRQREPWRADPGRTRATSGARRPPGGQRPPGDRSSRGGPAAPPGPGSRGGGRQRGAESSRTGAPSSGRRGTGSQDSRSASGQSTGRPYGSRRRATPGSTSYDATGEPFNPEWSGASWYGTTSGTYWTINPKEYADPRKHGPEYQARARRAQSAPASAEGHEDRRSAPGPSSASRPATDEPSDAPDERFDEWTEGPAGTGPPRYGTDGGPVSGWSTDRRFDVLAAIRAPSGLAGRAAIALLGWPPLGVAFAAIISETSGCGRFAASCVDTFDLGTWAGQLAIIGLLLALPKLASISAIGTLAMLTASVPGAILLSAAGGAQDRNAAASVLTAVLIGAYVVGVVIALARGTRTMRA